MQGVGRRAGGRDWRPPALTAAFRLVSLLRQVTDQCQLSPNGNLNAPTIVMAEKRADRIHPSPWQAPRLCGSISRDARSSATDRRWFAQVSRRDESLARCYHRY